MSQLQELIARLEKATGPDRELDEAIRFELQTQNTSQWNGPFYTSSIDAALTLLPRGWDYILTAGSGEYANASIGPANKVSEVYGEAPTPALAFSIAALKAHATWEER